MLRIGDISPFLVVGGLFWVCPRQIRSLSSVSSVENDSVILEIFGPRLENSLQVFSCCFLHTTLGLKETPCRIDIFSELETAFPLSLAVSILPSPTPLQRRAVLGRRGGARRPGKRRLSFRKHHSLWGAYV